MRSRVLTALVLIPLVLALLWWDPAQLGVLGAVLLLSWGMAWEFQRLLIAKGLPGGLWEWLLLAGAATAWALPARGTVSPPLSAGGWTHLVVFAVLVGAAARFAWSGRDQGGLGYLGAVVLGALLVGWSFSRSILMLYAWGGPKVVLWLLVTVWISDSAAYFVGRAVGRRPFAPRLSPKKTWEGTLGGLLAALGVGTGWGIWTLGLSPERALVGAGGVALLAPLGDLMESALKRDAGLKDSGNWIPGHGGLLDRLDSLVLSAPFLLLWLTTH